MDARYFAVGVTEETRCLERLLETLIRPGPKTGGLTGETPQAMTPAAVNPQPSAATRRGARHLSVASPRRLCEPNAIML